MERSRFLSSLTKAEAEELLHNWAFWARANQMPPEGEWRVWMIMAGRGFGKTRTGVEWVRLNHRRYGRWHFVGKTAADVRDVMVEGESGILRMSPKHERPLYEPSKRRLTWPNGAVASLFSSEEPDQLRGPQCEAFWADEAAAWKYPTETWDNLMFGFRLGDDPRGVVTTTPKPIKLVRELVADPTVVVTRGSTYENIGNLAPAFIAQVVKRYEGTRLGRQELLAELLDDTPGALWKRGQIDTLKVVKTPDLVRVVVGVDPQASEGEEASETGIVVAGLGRDGHGYVLDDLSVTGSPATWAKAAVVGYHKFRADRLVGEANNGGDMVSHTIHTVDKTVSFKKVHASRGKYTRAEPIAALYEQGRVHHVGSYPALEDQMCTWTPGEKSPDRMDALVWALTELMLGGQEAPRVVPLADMTRISPWVGR